MDRICIVTSKSRAYYALVSRLRRAGLPFESLLPDSGSGGCDLVLTTAEEANRYGEKAMVLEDLDENPGVFKGQIVSRLSGGNEVVLVGIDPGKRTGLAVFYGRTRLAFGTFNSTGLLCARIGAFSSGIPSSRFVVRVGNGNKSSAERLVELIASKVPWATIEIVDESGTSARTKRMRGVQGDQRAAAQIAFRKGEVVVRGTPRTHE